jgi:hypothetical protein
MGVIKPLLFYITKIFCYFFTIVLLNKVFLYLARTNYYFLNASLTHLYFISVRFKIQSHE